MSRLTAETAQFLEGPNSIMVASHDAGLVPAIARAVALRCAPDGRHLTVFLPTGAAAEVLAQLRADPCVAVVAELVSTHRTLQVKGRVATLAPTPLHERPFIEGAVAAFFEVCAQIGLPRRLTERLVRWPTISVEIAIEQVFEQSPGPGAGEPLGGAPAS